MASVEYSPRVRRVTDRDWCGESSLTFTSETGKEAGWVPAARLLLFSGLKRPVFSTPLEHCVSRMHLLQSYLFLPKVNDTQVTQSHQRGPYACLPALYSGSLAVGWSPSLSTRVCLLLTSLPSSQLSCPSGASSRQPSSSHQHPISHHHGTDIDILKFEASVMTELSKTGWGKTRQSWDSQN